MRSHRTLTRRDFMRWSASGVASLGFFLNGKWVPLHLRAVRKDLGFPHSRAAEPQVVPLRSIFR